jgi:hypothetical protein
MLAFQLSASAAVSHNPKDACGAAGSGLGIASVIIPNQKQISKAKYNALAAQAEGLLEGASTIVRANRSRFPAAVVKSATKNDPRKLAQWCRSKYPTGYGDAFSAGVAYARSHS